MEENKEIQPVAPLDEEEKMAQWQKEIFNIKQARELVEKTAMDPDEALEKQERSDMDIISEYAVSNSLGFLRKNADHFSPKDYIKSMKTIHEMAMAEKKHEKDKQQEMSDVGSTKIVGQNVQVNITQPISPKTDSISENLKGYVEGKVIESDSN